MKKRKHSDTTKMKSGESNDKRSSKILIVLVLGGSLLLVKALRPSPSKVRSETIEDAVMSDVRSETMALEPRAAVRQPGDQAQGRKSTQAGVEATKLPQRSLASINNDSDDPGDTYIDEGALPPKDEFGASDIRSHFEAFDYVHRRASAFLSYLGMSRQRLKVIDRQSELLRTEIRELSRSPNLNAADANRLVQASMSKYYRLLARHLTPHDFNRLMNELESPDLL